MATANFADISGNPVTIQLPLAPARAPAATSRPVVLSDEDLAKLETIRAAVAATNTLLATLLPVLGAHPTVGSLSTTESEDSALVLDLLYLIERINVLVQQGIDFAANTSPVPITVVPSDAEYEKVAASQTAQVLGTTGAIGNYIACVLVVPATLSPGAVTLLDNAISIPLFVGGTVGDLKPFLIGLGMNSVSGAWKLTTGANVSCIAIGDFT